MQLARSWSSPLTVEFGDSSTFRSSLYKNLTLDTGVFGQVRQLASFSFVSVFNAGHEVGLYQPALSQEVWQRAIFRKDIATGKEDTTDKTSTIGYEIYESITKGRMDPGPFLAGMGVSLRLYRVLLLRLPRSKPPTIQRRGRGFDPLQFWDGFWWRF